MRRKEKHIYTYAGTGFVVTAIGDVLFQWIEHIQSGKPFTWDSYNGKRTLRNAVIGAGVGAGIGYLTYELKLSQESKYPFNSDDYIKSLLTREQIKKNPAFLNRFLEYRSTIKGWLMQEFQQILAGPPEDAGSFHKRTAINSNYDVDIIVPFKRNSFSSLKEMYYAVYDKIKEKFGYNAFVNKETKAIGVTFEYEQMPLHFDIVPGREINDYSIAKDLNLYVRPDWIWQRGSSFKTNVGVQKEMTKNQPVARRIIKLTKIYRERNNFQLPSVIIEQCICDALLNRNFGVSFSDTDNFINSLTHLSKRLQSGVIIDRSNTNNNLLDSVSNEKVNGFVSQIHRDIDRIISTPRYIKEIFE